MDPLQKPEAMIATIARICEREKRTVVVEVLRTARSNSNRPITTTGMAELTTFFSTPPLVACLICHMMPRHHRNLRRRTASQETIDEFQRHCEPILRGGYELQRSDPTVCRQALRRAPSDRHLGYVDSVHCRRTTRRSSLP